MSPCTFTVALGGLSVAIRARTPILSSPFTHIYRLQMSSPELSPKYPRVRALSTGPFSEFSTQVAPFLEEEDLSPRAAPSDGATPSPLQKQPTAMDLIQNEDVILDPATPSTPKHRQAEAQMLQGPAAQVLKRHMDSVVKGAI